MDKDITRKAVEKAARLLLNAQNQFRTKIPYGPGQIKLTPVELRRAYERSAQQQASGIVTSLLQRMDIEEAFGLLTGIRPKKDVYDDRKAQE